MAGEGGCREEGTIAPEGPWLLARSPALSLRCDLPSSLGRGPQGPVPPHRPGAEGTESRPLIPEGGRPAPPPGLPVVACGRREDWARMRKQTGWRPEALAPQAAGSFPGVIPPHPASLSHRTAGRLRLRGGVCSSLQTA